jgi:hypothetical protein
MTEGLLEDSVKEDEKRVKGVFERMAGIGLLGFCAYIFTVGFNVMSSSIHFNVHRLAGIEKQYLHIKPEYRELKADWKEYYHSELERTPQIGGPCWEHLNPLMLFNRYTVSRNLEIRTKEEYKKELSDDPSSLIFDIMDRLDIHAWPDF